MTPTGRADALVIGSGPSGWAATEALLEQGRHVTVLDVGLQPSEDARFAAEERARAGEPPAGSPAGPDAGAAALAPKLLFGTDVPYRAPNGAGLRMAADVGVLASFAFGGLSTVWGASILPYRARDMRGWPIGEADLAPHVEHLLRAMPTSITSDALAARFPTIVETDTPLQSAPVVEALYRDIVRRRADCGSVLVGRSRLAVSSGSAGCIYCGNCMDGCPFDHIFSSAVPMRALADAGAIDYRAGALVHRVAPVRDGVEVTFRQIEAAEECSIRAASVYVAAGVIGSAAILMRSARHLACLHALDSQYFLAPVLIARGASPTASQFTLAQLFAFAERRSPRHAGVHMQIYAPNERTLAALEEKAGRIPLARRAVPYLHRRLLAVQGFLHSDVSGRLCLARQRDGGVCITAQQSRASRPAARIALRMLGRVLAPSGAFVVPGQTLLPEVGRSMHVGGTLPMAAMPNRPHQTNTVGTLAGLPGVHVVDASIFPTVPAPTITLAAMANARRIALETA